MAASAPSTLRLPNLPAEVLVRIFSLIRFDEQQLLHLVCRRFDAVLNTNSHLYQHLNLVTNCVGPLDFDFARVSSFFERHAHAVESLCFASGPEDEDALRSHAAWPTCALPFTPSLACFFLDGPSNDELCPLLARCTHLTTVSFNLPEGSSGLSSGLAALSALPRLRELDVDLSFGTTNDVRDVSLLTQLTSLKLHRIYEDLRGALRPLTGLQSLRLLDTIGPGNVAADLPLATGLTCLHLVPTLLAKPPAPPAMLARCTALQDLMLGCDLSAPASGELLGPLMQLTSLSFVQGGVTELPPSVLQLTALNLLHFMHFWEPGTAPRLPPGITRLSALSSIRIGQPKEPNVPRHIELPACITALQDLKALVITRRYSVHIFRGDDVGGEDGAGGQQQQRRLEVRPSGLARYGDLTIGNGISVRWRVVGEKIVGPPRTAQQLNPSHRRGGAAAAASTSTGDANTVSSASPHPDFLDALAYLEKRLFLRPIY